MYEKLPVLQRCHLSVCFECWFLVLFAGPSFMKALLLSGFVLLALYRLCSSESVFYRAPFQFDWFIVGLFLWLSSIWLLLVVFCLFVCVCVCVCVCSISSGFFS